MRKSKPTHGEAWASLKFNLDFKQDTLFICKQFESQRLPKKMGKKKAKVYYTNKLSFNWAEKAEVKPRDFIKLEHWFDYNEALLEVERLFGKGTL